MIYFSSFASKVRLQAATFSALVSVFFLASAVRAADLDFVATPSGDYDVNTNWYDYGDPLGDPDALPDPIPPTPPNQPASFPGINDNAYIRNGAQLVVDGDWYIGNGTTQVGIPNPNLAIRVGWRRTIPVEDPENPGTYLPFPDNREELGMPGSMLWTAGEITGYITQHQNQVPGFFQGGPQLRIGQHISVAGDEPEELYYPGTVVQNGPTTKINIQYHESRFRIGDHDGTGTGTPTSSYTLENGTIGTSIGTGSVGGGNENNGIDVRNGYFHMNGGQIVDSTPLDYFSFGLTTQRFLTIASVAGTSDDRAYAEANINGGSINSLGGIRIGLQSWSKGVLNINANVNILLGEDFSIGYGRNAGFGMGEVNMSAGFLKVGRNASDSLGRESEGIGVDQPIPNPTLNGRLQVGHRGPGKLNLSGGTIISTNDTRIGAEASANDSDVNITGSGSLITNGLSIRYDSLAQNVAGTTDTGSTVLVDGPTASLTVNNVTNIGRIGKGTLDVRQGTVNLGSAGGFATQLAFSSSSNATIKLSGGKLIVGGQMLKGDLSAAEPTIELTGGTLEFHNQVNPNAQTWQTHFNNTGSHLITKPEAQLQVVVGGDDNHPANFSMSSGSWDLDIGLNEAQPTLGADWFNANRGTASLTGGTLNINLLDTFVPANGASFRIARGTQGVTLDAQNITITGDHAANWSLDTNALTNVNFPNDAEIILRYAAAADFAGDYNDDGAVDAADYVMWRHASGNPNFALQNDSATPGFQNPGDIDRWTANFGNVEGGGGSSETPVPEPASIVLLGLFASVALASRRVR